MKQLVVSTQDNRTRIALLEQGKLVELLLDSPSSEELVGNVYRARVVNIIANMQAAFIDIGQDKNAFLYIDDALPANWKDEQGKLAKPSISEVVRTGEELFVQVTKEAFGSKAPCVTTEVSIPGRHLVYLPFSGSVSISRRIRQTSERKRLQQGIEQLLRPEEGVIIRTSAEGVTIEQLETELGYLRTTWQDALETAKGKKLPWLVYQDSDFLTKTIRDVFTEDIQELLVDSSTQIQPIKRMVKALSPQILARIKSYTARQPIFSALGVDEEVGRLLSRQVPLSNGGSIVIDRTEAMTVIDVNSGKYTGKSMQRLEETVTQTNLEAAKEIARQLRLRDIGGIVVIDFINMNSNVNREKVLDTLRNALASDRTTTHVFGMTQLGLVELTRKKVRQSVPDLLTRPCPTCKQTGRILLDEEVISQLSQEIRALVYSQKAEAIIVRLHPALLEAGEQISGLGEELGIQLFLQPDPSLLHGQYQITYAGSSAGMTNLLTIS